MSSRITAGLTAAVVTALCGTCLGTLLAGFDFFAIDWIEIALEHFGVLPDGWGQSHFSAIVAATAITAAPPLLYLGVLLFRHSYRVEMELGADET